jgi:23S rRNA-/tRNA-specific pseudouridylate synthase
MVTRGKMVINKRGKDAKSEYQTIESFKDFSLVKVKIYTGRMHQIRVHMASIGHPLMIDALYGKRSGFLLSEIKRKKFNVRKNEEERPMVERQTLHAASLTVTHPFTEKRVTFEAEMPKDMSAILNQLSKWNRP